jgi:hypothetical protein
MGELDEDRDRAGEVFGGPSASGSGDGAGEGSIRERSSEVLDSLPSRPRQRVPELKDVTRLQAQLVESFKTGDPEIVWTTAHELLRFTRSVVVEAARWRFKANFGTSVCSKCRGLMAGPGVTATCYQRGLCYYRNFTEEESLITSEVEAIVAKDETTPG